MTDFQEQQPQQPYYPPQPPRPPYAPAPQPAAAEQTATQPIVTEPGTTIWPSGGHVPPPVGPPAPPVGPPAPPAAMGAPGRVGSVAAPASRECGHHGRRDDDPPYARPHSDSPCGFAD